MLEDYKKYLGQKMTVTIDRPLGFLHPDYTEMMYPVNYGFIENTRAGDGEEIDAYVLGVDQPLQLFIGQCIAVIHRLDDSEDKLVVAPECMYFSEKKIKELTNFQEKYFKSEIIK